MIDNSQYQRGFVDGEWQDGELRGLTFLAGERGMGKTTEAIRLVELCTGPVIFFDTLGTHVRKLKGFKAFSEPGAFKKYVVANVGRRIRAVYVPHDTYPERHLVEVCNIIRILGKDHEKLRRDDLGYIVGIDEIDAFCGAKWGEDRMPRPLYELAQYGRHFHTSMLCTAREPTTLSPRFRSQCATMRLFRTTEEGSVDYFKPKIGKANAARMMTLQKTYFLLWSAGSQDVRILGGPRRVL